jgi:hypothetical protein
LPDRVQLGNEKIATQPNFRTVVSDVFGMDDFKDFFSGHVQGKSIYSRENLDANIIMIDPAPSCSSGSFDAKGVIFSLSDQGVETVKRFAEKKFFVLHFYFFV